MRRALFSTVLLLLCAPAFAQVKVAWAHTALSQGPLDPKAKWDNEKAAVGAPDGRTVGISTSNFVYLSFRDSPTSSISDECVRRLGITARDLSEYDILAFEGNENHTNGWESSVWLATDFRHAAAGSFSGDTCDPKTHQCTNVSPSSPLKFKSGTVTKAQYQQCFGHTLSTDYASWVLIDVPSDVRVSATEFRLWVSGALIGPSGYNNPDPDAFGIILHN